MRPLLLKYIGEQKSGKFCVKGITCCHGNPIYDALILKPRTWFYHLQEELLNKKPGKNKLKPDAFPKILNTLQQKVTKQGKRSRSSFDRADRNVKRQVN